MSQNTLTNPAPASLARANHRRQALLGAMAELEAAVAGPIGSSDWLDRVGAGLAAVRRGLQAHIDEVEGAGGIIADITSVAPRLTGAAIELEGEHVTLMAAMERSEDALSSAGKGGPEERIALRRRVMSLLGHLTRHRQHGSDLVYEAYNVDIEAAD